MAITMPALVAATVGVLALGTPAAASTGSTPTGAATVTSDCAAQLTGDQRLDATLTGGITAAAVRSLNSLSRTEYTHLVEDDTTWLNECGRVYVIDEAVPAHAQDVADPAPAAAATSDVFDLSSRPNSNRTIYLDFDGATYTGTSWNNGAEVTSPAYSIDADRATFTDTERAQIYLAWRSVAEDYSPFDVNVTTRVPAPEALTRTSAGDTTYGTTVVITPTNAAGATCGCGGQAYVGVFGNPGANAYHPAFVYTNGVGTGGYNVGQVISHEAGHTLGLHHDGTAQGGYYSGSNGYGPIMGSSYGRRVSHWSNGEYTGANTTEDDIAIIAGNAPLLADDHADTRAGATLLQVGASTAGLITTRTDTDAFTFTATGITTVTATGPEDVSNTDVRLTIIDANGSVVADINPGDDFPTNGSMAASWSTPVTTDEQQFTAIVDGTGYGNPAQAGQYSDYGSIGSYTIALTDGPAAPTATTASEPTQVPPVAATLTQPQPQPQTSSETTAPAKASFTTSRLPKARAGKAYKATIRFTGKVTEARVASLLPPGLRWTVRDGAIRISGKAHKAGTIRVTVKLTGPAGTTTGKFRIQAR